ncbi:MAG: M20/M25/M40 family metallo-hydrolase [Defluviitaleaceae bacterium]|nr:M20/M25/M40 family metallo-hydrolase [Defluviitaleaceae bacterium]
MSKINSVDLIKDLTSAFGCPGFEDDVVAVARKYAPDSVEIVEDSMRNLYFYPKGGINPDLPTVLVDAHSDEVGMMVQAIKDNGTLTFMPLGMWSPPVLLAQKLVIKNRKGEFVYGVVASRPPHFGGNESDLKVTDMVIDIGATSKEEVMEKYHIGVACPIVPFGEFNYNQATDIMMSKAFDCRLGCAAVIEVIEQVATEKLGINVIGALSAQEEVGMRGAKVVANVVKPDVAICFEGTPADDTFAPTEMIQTALKKGPMLRHIDPGMITHPRFIRLALDVAEKKGIPVQESVRTGGFTNGSAYQVSQMGVPNIIIAHPSRHVHSPNSIAYLPDYKNGVKLAVEILRTLDKNIIDGF